MKRILFILLMIWSVAQAQTAPSNYTNINSRYQWLAGRFKSLALPAGDTAFASGEWPIAGAVKYDSTKPAGSRFYIWNGSYWESAGGGAGTLFGRTDARNNTGAGLSFSNAGLGGILDSLSTGDNEFFMGGYGDDNQTYISMQGGNALYLSQNTISSGKSAFISLYNNKVSISSTFGGTPASISVADSINIAQPYTSSDTSLYKPLGLNNAGNSVRMNYWPSGGAGSSNSNAGSGYRWLKPAGQEIKTSFAGYGVIIDSTTNTDGLTIKADTATLFPAVRATITSGFMPAVTVSSSTSLSLTNTGSAEKTYVYTGSSNATWTLPAIGTTGQKIRIKNRGTGELTVQRAGSNQIYSNGTFTELILLTGDSETLQDDGTYWITI